MTAATRANVIGTGRSLGYGALIGNSFFQLAVSPDRPLTIVTAPLEAQRINTGVTSEDFSNEFGTRFSRSSFAGGEGLVYAQRPNPAESDGTRYFDSRNVQVNSDGDVTLLEATEQMDTSAATGLRGAYVDGAVYVAAGTTLRVSSDPTVSAPTFADEDPHLAEGATTVTDVVGIGTTVYASVGDGIHRKVSAGSWVHWHTRSGVERLWEAKGRLFAAVGNALYVYDTGGTPTEATALTIAVGETFNGLCDASSHVLVTSSDGNIYAFTDDGTTLALAGRTNLEGEEPCGIGEALGVVMFGTRVATAAGGFTGRLYVGAVGAGAVLDGLQRVRTWDATTVDRCPLTVFSHGDSLFTAVAESATEANLWRYDLGRAALHRSYIVSDTGSAARSIFAVGDVLWATVDGSGVWRRSDLFAGEGYIIGPLGDLFTAQDKSWASIALTFSDMVGSGERVTLLYSTATDAITLSTAATWRRLSSWTRGDTTAEANMPEVIARYLSVQVKLAASSDLAVSPKVRAFSARAYPQSDELIVRMPISVSDHTERPGKARVSVRGRGQEVLDQLIALEGEATTLELPHLGEALRGIVEQVERPVLTLARRGGQGQFAVVTFRGARLSNGSDTGGAIVMGTTFNGDGLMGRTPLMGRTAV